MKKIIIPSLFLSFGALCSCSVADELFRCNLTYDLGNGQEIVREYNKLDSVVLDNTITIDNCELEGWYFDEFYESKAYDIIMTKDIRVYAKWTLDEDYVKSSSTVILKDAVLTYNEASQESSTVTLKQGTAFVFDEDDNYYYLLTNNHVTVDKDDYKYIYLNNDKILCTKTNSISFEDHMTGRIVKSNYHAEIEEVYSNNKYDLSIIKLSKVITDYGLLQRKYELTLPVLNLSNEELKKGDMVMSYGSPNGNRRTLTGGFYVGQKKVRLSELGTDVSFEVDIHTSLITNGSSGGPLFNDKGEVVAVNYAGATSTTGDFLWGAAIPLYKVNEFLNQSNYK